MKIIHGFGPGGPVDLLARMVAAEFPAKFGQQAVVEAKPGAGGTVGANFVAKAAPDGYTLFLMASGHAAAPGLYASLPYDPVGDFTMISMVARSPFAIVANPTAPFKTVQELVQQAKAQPGAINYGSPGIGTGMHLAAVLMLSRLGLQMTHVSYRSGGALNAAVMAGEVPVMFTSLAALAPILESGRLRGLAVTSKSRFAGLPDIPTVAETVLPDFDVSAWYAVAGPKGLDDDVTVGVNEMIRAALARPDIQEKLRVQAAVPWTTTPQEAQAFVATEVAHWTGVIRAEKIAAPS
ncbi:MAG: tripartite tricarboxylate transporter substrate binding protein [Gammaproteobacteria bacterium]|nr:tripartite tricarboxylate transporter substrate binding protein [Gammaproteobacteria bacterium]